MQRSTTQLSIQLNFIYEQLRVVQQQKQRLDIDLVSGDSQESSCHLASDDDFFSFGTETHQASDATVEVDMYLTDTVR